ncbi:crossover junction endodeoxyribonuclease RuvC [Candidatus Falkowbacteria bacterium RIFOXYC2_FULL_47_12]|uniref:Crossover junction endodeoxyribonuclease RuvC n=2 Tax=Candidatus Falkowiibacteriota TaxID=1752728 RepID=A0A1F5TNR9_9BACT|nr:MAG: crossover junction endodeoxyribonuclease RuvC [Candidatus Falkowbacteria bacterium RIFOXYA2_FULL_47_9]OGF40161.1 MAG: crossover junction endodeoxyribonuclease RuvC [Candidatus Falkowbacteria bacterium RIFOXYC2_FULL_47_12]
MLKTNSNQRIILGIDPGTAITGFGLIEVAGQTLRLIRYGCITTPAGMAHAQRLLCIHTELKKIIVAQKPDAVAVEKLFFYNNAKTASAVGEARGVVSLTVAQAKLPLYEFTPLQVKQAVSAYGKASKLQVQKMVAMILKLKEIPKPDDAADALAVAICCANSL